MPAATSLPRNCCSICVQSSVIMSGYSNASRSSSPVSRTVVLNGRTRGGNAEQAGAAWFPAAARGFGNGAPLARAALSCVARRAGANEFGRACAAHHRSSLAGGQSGLRACRFRPVPERIARRRAFPLVVTANPQIIEFVALILGVAPRLADTLAHNPHLIDLLIDPSFLRRAARRRSARRRALPRARRERGVTRIFSTPSVCSARNTCS